MMKRIILIFIAFTACGYAAGTAFAQTGSGTFYVPLIGITSVPNPLALPGGAGTVTYHYAVKNFLQEAPLTDVRVIDDTCNPVTFVAGDNNGNGELDYGETWIYACTIKISTTTESTATATGIANNLTATDVAHATVVVGSNSAPPLVDIADITKVAYPLSLPSGGGSITFTYRVTNPGQVPLSDVTVNDDKCSAMSGHLGDTNGNNLLDTNEVWIYTCTAILTRTTTNTATVTAYANGLKAVDEDTITVDVATNVIPGFPDNGPNPGLPDNGENPHALDMTLVIWGILAIILAALIIFSVITRKKK
jgi:hypothetical protein